MTLPPVYYKSFATLDSEERKNFRIFLDALEVGGGINEKLVLYEDILSEHTLALNYVFKGTRHDDVQTIARNELTRLAPRYIQKDQRLFENILIRAADNGYDSKSQKVINNLYVLYASCDYALSYTFTVKQILGNPKMTFAQQIMFTRVLSESEDALRIDWDEFDLVSYPQAVPAYANFFKTDAPFKALRSLVYLPDNFTEEHSRFIYYCIEDCLIKIAKKALYDDYVTIYDMLSTGVKNLIAEIIENNVNLNNYFIVEAEHQFALEIARTLENNHIFIQRDLRNIANGITF